MSLTRVDYARIRAHLGALRTSLTQARDALMHFKADRVDRDTLEPAARRVDDLMLLFAGNMRDTAHGPAWVAEIQVCVEQVSNPKVADVLRDARAEITVLLEVLGPVD